MRIFICAGEPSGDIHGSNLVRELKKLDPDRRMRRLRRRTHGRGGLPAALSALSTGGHVVCPRPGQRPHFLEPAVAGRSLFSPSTSRRGRSHRLSRLQLVAGTAGPFSRHSRASTSCRRSSGAGPAGASRRCDAGSITSCARCPSRRHGISERGVQAHYVGHPFFDEFSRQRLDEEFLAQASNRSPSSASCPDRARRKWNATCRPW